MGAPWSVWLSELSPRARRAIGLMLAALVAVGAASAYYLKPRLDSAAESNPLNRLPLLHPGFLASYSFVSSNVGWTVQVDDGNNSLAGPYWVFKTNDGGRRWREQLSGRTPFTYLTAFSLQFIDANSGYITAGAPLSLYRTRDGGEHWTRLQLPANVNQVQFVDELAGYAVVRPRPPDYAYGPIRLLATRDGGETWDRLPTVPNDPWFGPRFRNRSEAWSGTRTNERPYVYVSLDGAQTWARRDLPSETDQPVEVLTALDFVPDSPRVIAIVYTSSPAPLGIYSSSDFGLSWRPVRSPAPGRQILSLEYADSTHWWAIADRALFKTADGGESWIRAAAVAGNVRLIRLIDGRHAWAELEVTSGVGLVQSSDGGRHWTPANLPQPY